MMIFFSISSSWCISNYRGNGAWRCESRKFGKLRAQATRHPSTSLRMTASRKRKFEVPLLLHFFLLFSCAHTSAQEVESVAYNIMLKGLLSHSVNEVSVSEIAGDTTILFVDAREKREYEVSHVHNAVWVGYADFNMSRVANIGKETKIVVYCSVGYRSEKIAEKMKQAGYITVSNLYGGIFEWKNQKQPVYDATNETNRVHAYSKTWGVWLNEGEKVYD